MTAKPKATKSPKPDAPSLQEVKRQHEEDNLDEALEETFPASDPISPSHID